MSNRAFSFTLFATLVRSHIENYTVPQYGDAPDDQIEQWTPEQCMDSIKRYCNRFGSGRRGRIEELRDMVKVAHLAQITFDKMKPTIEEVAAIREGRL